MLACGLAHAKLADQVFWTGAGGDALWTNAANWNTQNVPNPNETAVLALSGDYEVIFGGSYWSDGVGAVVLDGTSGSPTLQIPSAQTLVFQDTITVGSNATLLIDGGAIEKWLGQNVEALQIDGTVIFRGGAIDLDGDGAEVAPGATLIFEGTEPHSLRTTVTNLGVTVWNSSGPLVIWGWQGFGIRNEAEFILEQDLVFTQSGHLYNSGVLRVPAGSGAVSLQTLGQSTFQHAGVIDVGSGALFTLRSENPFDAVDLFDGCSFTGEGAARIETMGLDTVHGDLHASIPLEFAGSAWRFGDPVLKGAGPYQWSGGAFHRLTIAEGVSLTVVDSPESFSVGVDELLLNHGTLLWRRATAGMNDRWPSVLQNEGFFRIEEEIPYNFNTTLIIQNEPGGVIEVDAPSVRVGTLMNAGELHLYRGALEYPHLFNESGARCVFYLRGPVPETDYAVVRGHIGESNGTLELVLHPDYSPPHDTRFILIENTWPPPQFEHVALPGLPLPLEWETEYGLEEFYIDDVLSFRVVARERCMHLSHPVAGTLKLSIAGPPGGQVAYQFSTNHVDWVTFAQRAAFDGWDDVVDADAEDAKVRFYRFVRID